MITFVTCLIHLTPYDNYNERMSIENYFEHVVNILQQNVPLVIFIERNLENKLRELVEKYRPNFQTVIIPTSLPDMPIWSSRDKFISAVKPSGASPRMTPEYFMLTWSKFDMMKKCIKINPFKSSHFVWIDFGLGHVSSKDTFQRLSEFKEYDKFRICKYWTCWYPLCIDFINTISTVWAQTPGGLWMTTPENFPKIYKLFFEHGNIALKYGKICLEEEILTYLRNKYPEDFDSFYGTYQTLIQSFCGDSTMNDWSVRVNIQNMIQSTNSGKERSIEFAKHVLQMIEEGKHKPDEPSLIPFLQQTISEK